LTALTRICGSRLTTTESSLAGETQARASDRSITTLVPAEALVVYTALPFPTLAPPTSQQADSQATGSPGFGSITGIISFMSASGLMPDEGQVFADIATALPLLGQFEHALVLLDVSSRAVENTPPEASATLRLNRLQSAVIFRTDGRHKAVLQQL